MSTYSAEEIKIRKLREQVEGLTRQVNTLREAVLTLASYVPNSNYVYKKIYNQLKDHSEKK